MEFSEEPRHPRRVLRPEGGDQRFDLVPVEPYAVPPRAPVNLHLSNAGDDHPRRTADASSLAFCSRGSGGDLGAHPVGPASLQTGELVDLPRIEPGPLALQAPVDLDAVEFEDHHRFPAHGTHSRGLLSVGKRHYLDLAIASPLRGNEERPAPAAPVDSSARICYKFTFF